jgi:hypothetical protein
MAAGEADRRADAVGVEERSAVRCPLMKRLGCRPASSTLMFRMSKSGRAARHATIDRGSRREGLTLAADRRMAATDFGSTLFPGRRSNRPGTPEKIGAVFTCS